MHLLLPIKAGDLTVFASQIKLRSVDNCPISSRTVEDAILTTLQTVSPYVGVDYQFAQYPKLLPHFVDALNRKYALGITYFDLVQKVHTPGVLALTLYLRLLTYQPQW